MYETYPPRNAPTGFLGGGTVPMLGVAGAAASERTTRVVERALLESAEEAGRAEAASRRTAVDMVVMMVGRKKRAARDCETLGGGRVSGERSRPQRRRPPGRETGIS